MPAVRRIETRYPTVAEYLPTEQYIVTLTKDETATTCKSALHWGVDKEKALELIINGGMIILREVLPPAGHPRPPEID